MVRVRVCAACGSVCEGECDGLCVVVRVRACDSMWKGK